MTNKKEVAQAIWNTYVDGYSKALMTPVEQFDTSITSDSRKIVANVLRALVSNNEEWVDGTYMVKSEDILNIATELENL